MTERRVLAQGTFDLLHPGHLHYLRAAAERGDELHVVVGRRRSVDHKPEPVLPDRQRRDVVAGLSVVDRAHLGHPRDVFAPVVEIDPAVIVIGHDQHHDVDTIAAAAADRGVDCEVVRAPAREPRYTGELLSSGDVVERVLAERGERAQE